MARAASLPWAAALSLAVAACAGPTVAPLRTMAPAIDEPFAIDGRLTARRGKDVVALTFAWKHDARRDELVLTTVLGHALAELTGDSSARRVEVRTADGRHDEASDWATLTERIAGIPLPVGGLAWWARGAPRPDAPHAVESDNAGRASVLRQDGCEIVYAYADDSAPRPARLNVGCHDVEMRIVIDEWRAA